MKWEKFDLSFLKIQNTFKGFLWIIPLLSFCFVSSVHARPGDLDLRFNGTGKVITNISEPIPYQEYGRTYRGSDGKDALYDVVVQPDGKIVGVGYTSTTVDCRNGACVYPYRLTLVRYLSNGILDSSFGTGGIVITDFIASLSDSRGFPEALSAQIKIQNDGNLLVATAIGESYARRLILARFTGDNGSLDTHLGGGWFCKC